MIDDLLRETRCLGRSERVVMARLFDDEGLDDGVPNSRRSWWLALASFLRATVDTEDALFALRESERFVDHDTSPLSPELRAKLDHIARQRRGDGTVFVDPDA